MGLHFCVAERTFGLRKKIAKIADAHRREGKGQFRGPGIFSKMPNPDNATDIELPPMGLDFAFDFGVEGKDIFFLRDGEWCIRQEDVMYIDERRNKKKNNGQHRSTRRPRSMSVVDEPKPAHLRNLTKHVSEDGWHLQTDHERHLLSFPQEILNSILRHILVLQGPGFFNPSFSSCHADTKVPIFEYRMCDGKALPTTTHNLRTDGLGPYYEVRAVHRRAIDATVLRTCKKLYKDGIDLLYSNKFLFFTGSGWPSILEPNFPQADKIEPALASLLDSTQQRAYLEQLERDMYHFNFLHDHLLNTFRLCWGPPIITVNLPFRIPITHWIGFTINRLAMSRPHLRSRENLHWDDFLWFLWIIGSKNASRIKTMGFHNLVSSDDLQTLKCYIAYIKFFCVGLENMRIDAGWHNGHEQADTQVNRNCVRTLALKGLLKREIRGIQNLRNLEVFDAPCRCWDQEADPASSAWHDFTGSKTVPRCAQSTISWIKERSLEMDHEKYLKDLSRDVHVASQEGDPLRMNFGMELLRWENARKDIRQARAAA